MEQISFREPLRNLALLVADMKNEKWKIDAFTFSFKKKKYVAVVSFFSVAENVPLYAIAKLKFCLIDDLDTNLEVPATAWRLLIDAKTLRQFFGIEYGYNLGDILKQFYVYLGKLIPITVNKNRSEGENNAMLIKLTNNKNINLPKVYCYAIRRNPRRVDGTLGQRSELNEALAIINNQDLFCLVGDDTNISFYFSPYPEDKKSDAEIMRCFSKKTGTRRK